MTTGSRSSQRTRSVWTVIYRVNMSFFFWRWLLWRSLKKFDRFTLSRIVRGFFPGKIQSCCLCIFFKCLKRSVTTRHCRTQWLARVITGNKLMKQKRVISISVAVNCMTQATLSSFYTRSTQYTQNICFHCYMMRLCLNIGELHEVEQLHFHVTSL